MRIEPVVAVPTGGDAAAGAGAAPEFRKRPYSPPHIVCQFRLEARAGTPMGWKVDPITGKLVDTATGRPVLRP